MAKPRIRQRALGRPTRISVLRERKGMTQAELAAAMGIHRTSLQRLESGLVENPGIRTLVAASRGLGVKLAAIVEPEWTAPRPAPETPEP